VVILGVIGVIQSVVDDVSLLMKTGSPERHRPSNQLSLMTKLRTKNAVAVFSFKHLVQFWLAFAKNRSLGVSF